MTELQLAWASVEGDWLGSGEAKHSPVLASNTATMTNPF